MFRGLICVLSISACFASDIAVEPLLSCGEIPNEIYKCLGNPAIFTPSMVKNCARSNSNCEQYTCAFDNAGWLKDGMVQKTKIKTRLDVVAKDSPQWSAAVQHAKMTCLTTDLPPQGVYLNCAPYDIVQCCITSFAQYALPSQWSTEEKCQYPKHYVATCPMCPRECFSSQVPFGSCNACLGLPRSS